MVVEVLVEVGEAVVYWLLLVRLQWQSLLVKPIQLLLGVAGQAGQAHHKQVA